MPINTDDSRIKYAPIDAATDVTASGTGAAAIVTATIPAVAGKTAYVTGFAVTGGGATAAAIVTAVLSGTISGSLSYVIGVPAGATTTIPTLHLNFSKGVPASAVNTAIVLTVPSFGAGNTNVAVAIRGYYL